jgi:ubiquinone/menaquinone biosynthesis C-methylase UbiE
MTTALTSLRLACPECRGLLNLNGELRCNNGHEFRKHGASWDLLPKSLSPLTADEGKYHAEQKETWIEQNQIDSVRALDAHRSFLRRIADLCNRSSHILEIGGGVGFDMNLFLQMTRHFQVYVFSEVSLELVSFAGLEAPSDNIVFCTLDAHRIPFADNQFDCVFMVAAFHHLPDMSEALFEIARVTKSGGFIAFGIEPNRWWLALLKGSRRLLRAMIPQKSHSAADEEALGLSKSEFEELACRHNLRIIHLQPVWFLCGYLHYGLELMYRVLRLKKRLRLPTPFERLFVRIDKKLLAIPGLSRFSWHYSVVYQKV